MKHYPYEILNLADITIYNYYIINKYNNNINNILLCQLGSVFILYIV